MLLAKFDELAASTLAPSQARELADLTLALDDLQRTQALLDVVHLPRGRR